MGLVTSGNSGREFWLGLLALEMLGFVFVRLKFFKEEVLQAAPLFVL